MVTPKELWLSIEAPKKRYYPRQLHIFSASEKRIMQGTVRFWHVAMSASIAMKSSLSRARWLRFFASASPRRALDELIFQTNVFHYALDELTLLQDGFSKFPKFKIFWWFSFFIKRGEFACILAVPGQFASRCCPRNEYRYTWILWIYILWVTYRCRYRHRYTV